ncbi:MAG: flagellar assembly protein FliW [Leptospiraceae bacterium]|nr:flagellar assembly protein FliW [Leptospiraceae bacterium]
MIEIDSKPFGKISIDESQILSFPAGILGFEDFTKFALIEEADDSVFKWLQSLDQVDLAFILIQPELFLSDYKPIIPKTELESIGLTSVDDSLKMVIVSIPGDDISSMTANLQGPIIINKSTHVGRQFISRDESHSVRKKILESTNKAAEKV